MNADERRDSDRRPELKSTWIVSSTRVTVVVKMSGRDNTVPQRLPLLALRGGEKPLANHGRQLVATGLEDVVQVCGDGLEGREECWIELRRRVRGNDPQCLLLVERGSVWTTTPKRLIHGNECDHACRQRNLTARQSVGVARAIPAFVVVPNNLLRDAQIGQTVGRRAIKSRSTSPQ